MVVYFRKSIPSLLSAFKKKAGLKGNDDQKRLAVHYTTSQHYQENVFIEGSRPQHLEELHTEAQEGLKILQREEHKNGVDFLDNETDDSTDTLRPDQDISFTDEGGCSVSTATTGTTGTTDTSAASTRPVLTRQGSTFKPLNPVKRLDKSRRRSRRTTIMGIPNQVHKELVNGVTPAANEEGARVHLPELEVSTDEKLLRNHLQAVFQDEKPFNQAFSSYLGPSSGLRPKSLAVPGITTSSSFSSSAFLMEPQGPVMSISPQATYLSTIIPNAVLPASVEVIEIDRSTSRARGNTVNHGGSVRTVSKSSLASLDSSVSPLLSRRYDSDGSQTDNSNNPTPMPPSVSGSNWSDSQSSKTIISHPSPVSSKDSRKTCDPQTVGVNGAESQVRSGGGRDPVSVQNPGNTTSTKSERTSAESCVSGSGAAGEETKSKQNCTRSLSVMKTKQPPAPPRRTNSLHCNKIRNNVQINNNRSDSASAARLPVLNSPGSTSPDAPSDSLSPTQSSSDEAASAAEPLQEFSRASPKKAPSEGGKFDRTMSPSSGYSSQSGTPTLSPKGVSQSSPDLQKRKPLKPERSMSRASSSAASPSSSLTSLSSGTSEPLIPDVSTCCTSPAPQRSPLTSEPAPTLRGEVKELLNIPPPPRVRAPCPPPPETWVHNRRTFELLCGPCPNVPKVLKTTTQAQDSAVEPPGGKTDDREISHGCSEQDTSSAAKVQTLLATRPEDVHLDLVCQDSPGTEQEILSDQDRNDTSADVQRRDETSGPVAKDAGSTADQPPVTKKTLPIPHGEEWPLTELSLEAQPEETCRVDVEHSWSSSQEDVRVSVDASRAETERSEVTLMQAFRIEPPKTTRISPPPTPPPAYHPTPPPSRRTPPSSVSVPPDELLGVLEEIHSVDSCWPPPPPPLEGGSAFDGGDEIEFPPPPPPVMGDNVPDVDCCSTEGAAVETVVESVKSPDAAETSPPRSPELPPAAPQTEVNDKTEGALQVSVDDTADISCSPVQVSDGLPPPSTDRAESPSFSAPLDSLTTPSPCDPLIIAPLSQTVSVPVAPPLPMDNLPAGVHFRRQPSVGHNRSKELLARHKSAPIPKEDAHIPLVTPSLLQMVRLRSVNMTEDAVTADSQDKTTNDEAPGQSCQASSPGHQNIPQKPIRKSLSLKHPAQTGKTSGTPNTPSMRLQEAIRMKAAAMTAREGLPCRLGVRSSVCLSEPGILLKSPEAFDALKTPASTASFIFSRSSRKLVLETAAAPSPEPQTRVKQNLATELMRLHDQSNAAAFSKGRVKTDRLPPPVARKPDPSSMNASQIPKMEFSVDGTISVQPTRETTPPETTTRVTADTIETLF